MAAPTSIPCPEPFLEIRVHRTDLIPNLVAACAGYEQKQWRSGQLAAHLLKWLPEFALTAREREALAHHNAVESIYRAARAVYTTQKSRARGEIGELLLHVILRQVFGTVPAISKIFFKDSSNDTVKGFDAVHVVAAEESLELWLGEAKFYDDIGSAITAAIAELKNHSTIDYLRAEFAAITNKVDDTWPHADRLKKLLHPNTSLDEVFDVTVFPVLLTYNSDVVGSFEEVSTNFKQQFEKEVLEIRDTFASRELPKQLRIRLFLFPMKNKAELVSQFDDRLKAVQAIG
jgi:hypothetical protein